MKKSLRKKKLLKETVLWGLSFVLVVVLLAIFPFVRETVASVTSNGMLYYGDTTNTGTPKSQTFTNPGTWGSEVSLDASEASNIVHLVTKTAPTRSELMLGHLNVNGRLWITQCAWTSGCDAAADFTPQWDNPGTTGTQDCDSAPTLDTCERAFDIGYEALGGRAMVVYGDNVTDKIYYALWDGSAWSPDSSPGTPSATNELDLPGTAGTPNWIRVIPAGDNLADDRSSRIIVLVADTDNDLYAFYWDGSSFDSGTEIFTTLGLCNQAQCFDGNWQGNNSFVVSYTNSGVSEVRYQKFVVGTGWGSDTQAYTTSATSMWITSAADPTSSRIYVSNATSGNDTRGAVWRADDATDGWTVCASGGCPDTTTEGVAANISYPAFERFGAEGFHTRLEAGNGTAQTAEYWTYSQPSTWSADNALGFSPTDDYMQIKAIPSPNDDDIVTLVLDVDCDADARMWDGSALQTIASNFELLVSSTNGSCANAVPIAGMSVGYAMDFAWKAYTPWQRNWQFFNGTDLVQTPTTTLAAQNTAPVDINDLQDIRLRINYAERGGVHSNTDARKKLQFTSGCNPNSELETTCTWTDVDDISGSGIWRYVNLACTPVDSCEDGTAIVSSAGLTGTSTCVASVGDGCGTWVLDKDAAAGSAMDHNAAAIQESEWIIEPNGAAGGTTYYFRIYDVQQDTPIYREQDANDCGAGSAQCTYPSLTTTTPAGPTTDEVLRHGRWFNASGVLQSFFWAD